MASSINASTSGGGGIITTADATGNLDIQSGGSTVVAVTSTGATVTGTLAATGASTFTGTGKFATTIGVGNATPSASGSGITFPATQSASTDANTLDDYEEGTFNPTIQNENSTAAFTYTNRGGNYTKVGRLVEVWFYMDISVTSAGTGLAGLQVSSLPFTPSSDNLTNSNYSRGGVALRHPTATTAFNLHFSGSNPSASAFLYWAALGAGSSGGATTGLQTGMYSGYVIYEA